MHIQRCTLTLQESVYYATREMGMLYETGNYLHNYALTYALFNDSRIRVPYFCNSYRPTYADDLAQMQRVGVYITPAAPLQIDYLLATWKIGQVSYYRKSEQFGGRNYPANIGRAKELAPESTFVCYVLSEAKLELPRWIRLGKWHSKALVETKDVEVKLRSDAYTAAGPLNPLDVPANTLRAFDIISMPPSSLVANARCVGEHYEIERGIGLPAGMQYTFPSGSTR
jgi:CRISPR-associated protein Csc1